MPIPRLTLRSVELRSVSIPLRRSVVSKVGRFDRWPFVLIDLHTEEGIVAAAILSHIANAWRATSSLPFATWPK